MPHPANGTSVCTLPKRQAQRNDIGAVTYWQSQNNLKARKKGREFGRERKVAQEKRGTESGANERGVSQKGERTTTEIPDLYPYGSRNLACQPSHQPPPKMPDLTIINNLDEAIHVAFFITAPTHWKNNLQPGERWTMDIPTLPLYFQARWVERTDYDSGVVYRSRAFCPEESWEMGATIGAACAAGTASVVIGVTSLFTGWGEIGVPISSPLMLLAHAGGNKYATMGSDTKLYETRVWVPWFEHKEYSVRMVGGSQCGLWDVKENRQIYASLAKQPSTVTVEPSPPTTEDERTNCMRMVNLSLQNLSVVTQSGWKFALEGTKNARNASANTSKVDDATRTARKALGRLRGIAPDDIDVERAACSITGKLITLELYEEAIQFLGDMHPRLLRIAATGQSSDEIPSPLHLLSLPHPTSDDPTVLTLLITFVTHALNALLFLLLRPSPPFSVSTLVTTLQHSHSLLAWASNMKHVNILDKTRDALLTKAYTFINKACTTLSSGSRSSADPKSIFYLRIHALSCLLYTTPGTVKSATFWDQVHKACLSYARAFSSESAEEKRDSTFAACISGSLSELTRLARNLHERTFSEGRSFVQMCETWMSFAQKGDISTMDHISELMGIPCTSFSRTNLHSVAIASKPALLSSSYSVDSLAARVGALKLGDSTNATGAEPASHRTTKDVALSDTVLAPELARHAKEATDALHRYCQLVMKLDSFISPNSAHPSTASSVPNSTSHSSTVDAEVLRARGKLERAVERLRRTGLRILDALQTQNEDSRTAAMSLLEVIATTLESSLTEDGTCFRQSSETKMRSRLGRLPVKTQQRSSGTLHNLGGTLYTAGRLGRAVRFLKEGCVLGRRVVAMYGSACTDQQIEENGKEKEGYELLGVCHSKIGDRKLAYEYFVESVRTFPYTHHLSSLSSLEPFAPSAPLTLKQLSSIVERLTYTATCELFLSPARVALSHISHAFSRSESTAESTSTPVPISTFPSDPRSAAEIVGALLTHQLTMLEGIGHKDGVRGVRRHLLEELLSVYNPSWALIQRAQVLVTALGVAWRDGRGEGDASTRFDVDRMGQEALELLGQEAMIPTDVLFCGHGESRSSAEAEKRRSRHDFPTPGTRIGQYAEAPESPIKRSWREVGQLRGQREVGGRSLTLTRKS
ncbi:hypothetical protein EV363DRAFT_1413348 [Boletus edulis]|nr:hypothetical protein EV363DRAFT_1413348 [Boletus edulis]